MEGKAAKTNRTADLSPPASSVSVKLPRGRHSPLSPTGLPPAPRAPPCASSPLLHPRTRGGGCCRRHRRQVHSRHRYEGAAADHHQQTQRQSRALNDLVGWWGEVQWRGDRRGQGGGMGGREKAQRAAATAYGYMGRWRGRLIRFE